MAVVFAQTRDAAPLNTANAGKRQSNTSKTSASPTETDTTETAAAQITRKENAIVQQPTALTHSAKQVSARQGKLHLCGTLQSNGTARTRVLPPCETLRAAVHKFHNAGVRGSSPCVATKQNKGLPSGRPLSFLAYGNVTSRPPLFTRISQAIAHSVATDYSRTVMCSFSAPPLCGAFYCAAFQRTYFPPAPSNVQRHLQMGSNKPLLSQSAQGKADTQSHPKWCPNGQKKPERNPAALRLTA